MPDKPHYHPEYLRRRIQKDFQQLRDAGWHSEALASLALKCVPELTRPQAKRQSLARDRHRWPLHILCEMIIAKWFGWDNETVSVFCGKSEEAVKCKWQTFKKKVNLSDGWTQAQEQVLIELLLAGHSFSQIGVLIGRTKNAVAGRVRDLRAAGRIPIIKRGLKKCSTTSSLTSVR